MTARAKRKASRPTNQTDRHSFFVDFGCIVWENDHSDQADTSVIAKSIVDSLCPADARRMAASGTLKNELKVPLKTIEMQFFLLSPTAIIRSAVDS